MEARALNGPGGRASIWRGREDQRSNPTIALIGIISPVM